MLASIFCCTRQTHLLCLIRHFHLQFAQVAAVQAHLNKFTGKGTLLLKQCVKQWPFNFRSGLIVHRWPLVKVTLSLKPQLYFLVDDFSTYHFSCSCARRSQSKINSDVIRRQSFRPIIQSVSETKLTFSQNFPQKKRNVGIFKKIGFIFAESTKTWQIPFSLSSTF